MSKTLKVKKLAMSKFRVETNTKQNKIPQWTETMTRKRIEITSNDEFYRIKKMMPRWYYSDEKMSQKANEETIQKNIPKWMETTNYIFFANCIFYITKLSPWSFSALVKSENVIANYRINGFLLMRFLIVYDHHLMYRNNLWLV